MTKTAHLNHLIFVFGIPLLFILGCVILVQTAVFANNQNTLSLAITIDLALSTPLVYYLLIRKRKIPKTTVIPVFLLGLFITSLIIPSEHQFLLQSIKTWILPLVEFAVIGFIGFKIYKTIVLFKDKKRTATDFFTIAKKVCSEAFTGKIAIFVATEITVFYYVFFAWKKKALTKNEFTYHKKTGSITIFVAFMIIIIVETLVLHGVLMKWNVLVAWIIFGLSSYTVLQIFALVKSIPRRPIVIRDNAVLLRYGIFNETTIAIEEIASIVLSTKEIESDSDIKKLSPLSSAEDHNVILYLKKEHTLTGFYGISKKYKTIAFYVDEKEIFTDKLNSLLNS